MKRLGVLYPPCGAEHEYYRYGEKLSPGVSISLIGVRIHGGDDEHAPAHLSRTAAIENLTLSARVLKNLKPAAAVWACTSGSFIDGPEHARAQTDALSGILGCPVTSTSLAFTAALRFLGLQRVSVLASYPAATASAFFSFLTQFGVEICDHRCLDVDSGPAAARIDLDVAIPACQALAIPDDAALLIPDTAIPTMHWIPDLEHRFDRPVLTANQVSLWHAAGLADVIPGSGLPGRLFAA